MWKVVKIEEPDWNRGFSENMHRAVFAKVKPREWDRISYALIGVKDEQLQGYVTVREHDIESVYWQFGGMLPNLQKSVDTVRCYQHLLAWQKQVSKRITTYTLNTNIAYLKLAMSQGFRIVGTRTTQGEIYVDLLLEFEK